MKILALEQSKQSLVHLPRRIPRLDLWTDGLDFSLGVYRKVRFADLRLVAVAALAGVRSHETHVLLFIAGEEQPFLVPASDIALQRFRTASGASLDDSLRAFIHHLCRRNPDLAVSENTCSYLQNQPPEEVPKGELYALATSLASALRQNGSRKTSTTEPVSASTETHRPARTSPRTRQVFATRSENADAAPPLLPPWSSALSYGPRRRAELLKGLRRRLEPPRISWPRALRLYLIALEMALLPILYLGLITAIGLAVLDFIANGQDPAAGLPMALLYRLLAIAGVCLALPLSIPLFIKRRAADAEPSLDRRQEPVLYNFVERLCEALGCRRLQRIGVDSGTGVSIGAELDADGKSRLTLNLGLSLIAGLTVEQLSSLIASRMTRYLRRRGSWLAHSARTVDERYLQIFRDSELWRYCATHSEDQELPWGISEWGIVFCRLLLFFPPTRFVLNMLDGFAREYERKLCRIHRVLDRDAELLAERLVGRESYTAARREWRRLRVAHAQLLRKLEDLRRQRRLPDHLPARVALRALRARVDGAGSPPLRPGGKKPPAFSCSLPATAMFRDFPGSSRELTRRLYASLLDRIDGIEPIEKELLSEHESSPEIVALKRYFGHSISRWRLLSLPAEMVVDARPIEELLSALRHGWQNQARCLTTACETVDQYDAAAARRLRARQTLQLIEAGFQLPAKELGFDRGNDSAPRMLEAEAVDRLETLSAALSEIEALDRRRLVGALAVVTSPDNAARLDDGQVWCREIPCLLAVVAQISELSAQLLDLRHRCTLLADLKARIARYPHHPQMAAMIVERSVKDLQSVIALIYKHLARTPNLFHNGGDPAPAIRGIANDHLHLGQEVLRRTYNLYFRALGRLVYIAEQVELASGLDPRALSATSGASAARPASATPARAPSAGRRAPETTARLPPRAASDPPSFKTRPKTTGAGSTPFRGRESGQLEVGGRLLDHRLELIERIGQGGFATVWKAYDKQARRLVAVKVLHPQLASDQGRRQRFVRGAEKMKELRHLHIVRVFEEKLEEADRHFFVMEYCGGGDLRQAILAGRFTLRERLRIILEIGEALDFAHSRGVIHRDVKPSNILLDGSHRPKLADFDLVRALDTLNEPQTQGRPGTLLYAPPERVTDESADIFALGMTAAFVVHGGDLPADVIKEPRSFIARLSCPDATKTALLKAVSWDVTGRFDSIAAFCFELKRSLEPEASEIPKPGTSGDRTPAAGNRGAPEVHSRRLSWWKFALACLGLALSIRFLANLDATADSLTLEDVINAVLDREGFVEVPAGVSTPEGYAFKIHTGPVTNKRYLRFLTANPNYPRPLLWTDEAIDQPAGPVLGLTRKEARAYCLWHPEMRLPSEAQWRAAAPHIGETRFPWSSSKLAARPGLRERNLEIGFRCLVPIGVRDYSNMFNVWLTRPID